MSPFENPVRNRISDARVHSAMFGGKLKYCISTGKRNKNLSGWKLSEDLAWEAAHKRLLETEAKAS